MLRRNEEYIKIGSEGVRRKIQFQNCNSQRLMKTNVVSGIRTTSVEQKQFSLKPHTLENVIHLLNS